MKGLERISRTLLAWLVPALLAGVTMAPLQAQTPVVRFTVERFEVEGRQPAIAGAHAGSPGGVHR